MNVTENSAIYKMATSLKCQWCVHFKFRAQFSSSVNHSSSTWIWHMFITNLFTHFCEFNPSAARGNTTSKVEDLLQFCEIMGKILYKWLEFTLKKHI